MNPTSETGAAPTTAPVPQDRTRRECSARRQAILELAGDYLSETAKAFGLGLVFRRRWSEARDAVLATENRPAARELFRRGYARQASHLRATHREAIASIALASVNHRRHGACPEN